MIEERVQGNGGISLDLTSQAKIANTNAKLVKRILSLLRGLADENRKGQCSGALIVLGEFVRCDYVVPDMRQIGTNLLTGKALYITGANAKEGLLPLLNEDGAIIVDTTGQMMAAQVYLQVNHAEAQVEEECSTRHISAASFSMNPCIIACFTMSEETGKVRHYVEGKQVSVYDPHQKEDVADGESTDDLDVDLDV